MPLRKKRDKARKRIERALLVQPNSNLNPVQPSRSLDGFIMEGNKIIGVKPKEFHGGRITLTVTAPSNNVEIDADGNPIPEY